MRRTRNTAFNLISDRLRLMLELLRNKFAHLAQYDLQRAEEQHRRKNQLPREG